MQKKLIALAIAGFAAAPAFAQTNVTVYGIVDAYWQYSDSNDAESKIGSGGLSGSRIGFRGNEDLGNGLKGVFVLEHGFEVDTGEDTNQDSAVSSSAFSRQAYVGLESASFGRISLGRQYAPGYFTGKYDPNESFPIGLLSFLSNGFDRSFAGSLGSTTNNPRLVSITPNTDARISNSLNWVSPTWGGFNVNALYGADENEDDSGPDTSGRGEFFGIGLHYSIGGFNIGYIYHQTAEDDDHTIDENFIGASYDFGPVAIFGTYQTAETDLVDNTELSIYTLGAAIPVGANGKIRLAYGMAEYDEFVGLDDDLESETSAWQIGYTYNLSKRTTLYTYYTGTENDDNVRTFPVDVGRASSSDGFGESGQALTFGVRHSF